MYPYQPAEIPTPSAVKKQKDLLKSAEITQFSQHSIEKLIANRTLFCDQLLCHLWQYFGLAKQTDLALIAVGGYGRQELFPLSDLDFLILSPSPVSTVVEQKITEFIQFLWDCHFEIGHSVRTLIQCENEGKADITIATNLLESRLLIGNQALFQELQHIIEQKDFWPAQAFFEAKIKEKKQRYQRYHNTSYNLEPDIKYSPGGLRDLHLLYWIALRHAKIKNLVGLLDNGFIYPEEYARLQRSQSFLFRIRFALHLILKRYDNRLLFERQLKVSEMLGFNGEQNQGVEKMMRIFFQALQTISLFSNILSKHYQEYFLTTQIDIKSAVRLDNNFILLKQQIFLTHPERFTQQPDTILDLFFHLTQQTQADIHPDTLRNLTVALTKFQQPLSDFPTCRDKFLALFQQPKAIERALQPMHQYGVLTAYLANWQAIVGLMQFDLFHTYTVDEHILRVMLKLESFLDQTNAELHPLCTRIFPQLSDRTLIYLAALFHDIGKGRYGDHSQLGAEDILLFAKQHGFNSQQSQLMSWLVEQHLLMSVVAQRRDIHDPEVVLNFATQIKNQERLNYLVCLTVADICATNETLWNNWKRSLLLTLFQYCSEQLQRGNQLLDYKNKIEQHRQQALTMLTHLNKESILTLWQPYPEDYFLRNTPKQIAWHTELLCKTTESIVVKVSNKYAKGGTEIFIYCPDQVNLFYKVVNSISAKNLTIHDAQIMTRQDGYVLDSFIVTEINGRAITGERRRALEKALSYELNSTILPPMVHKNNYKLRAFNVPTKVRFLNTAKTEQTEMELFALDKAGLLAEVSQIFTQLRLNLINAKITTVGEKAEDFFILTNAQAKALTVEERKLLAEKLCQIK